MKKVFLATLALIAIISFAFTSKSEDKKVTILISHEVKDFDAWKKGFDSDEVNRKNAGMKVIALYRSTDKPNVITGLIEAPNAEVANKFLSNPDLKANMEKAGVISAPDIRMLNKVQ
ncbi:MAG: hypothetical protein V4677_06310 [Bacteroidota bacterium]